MIYSCALCHISLMFHIFNDLFFKGGMYWDVLASTSRPSMEQRDVLASESQYIPHLKKRLSRIWNIMEITSTSRPDCKCEFSKKYFSKTYSYFCSQKKNWDFFFGFGISTEKNLSVLIFSWRSDQHRNVQKTKKQRNLNQKHTILGDV